MSEPSSRFEDLPGHARDLSPEERRKILSTAGIKLKLSLFVAGVLVILGGAMLGLVTEIFEQLTPSTKADLEWKAVRGARELAQRTELGIVLSDVGLLRQELSEFTAALDVVGIAVEADDGTRILTIGAARHWEQLFGARDNKVVEYPGALGSWSPATIEGKTVGRVGIFVSTARLRAGDQLRSKMIWATSIGAGAALLLCLLFVTLYIGPILRLTTEAFVRLEATTAAALEASRVKGEFLANTSHQVVAT